MDKKSSFPTTELLPDILDKMLEGVQIIGSEWRYIYLNEAIVRQSRQKKADLLGKTMMEAYPGIDNTPLFKRLKECMEDQKPHRVENEFLFPDGTKGWFLLMITPWKDGIMIFSVDITQQKELENKLFVKIEELDKMTDLVLKKEITLSQIKLELARLQHMRPSFGARFNS